ncbi:MAG: VC0807 family protein [Solirubrobacteraceae bacterium]
MEDSAHQPPVADRGRLRSLAPIVVFDIAGPLVIYSLLRSGGSSVVTALVLSGILPAVNVAIGVQRHRRLDAIGFLVLLGIAATAALGLITNSPKALLLRGSVATGVFGLVCLGSLWSRRPLMFRFALEFTGPDTPKGRDFADRWRYAGMRRTFRVITAVWGIAYLAEAVARVIIVESTSTGTAYGISKLLPYAVAGIVLAWMIPYGARAKRKGERLGAEARASTPAPARPDPG